MAGDDVNTSNAGLIGLFAQLGKALIGQTGGGGIQDTSTTTSTPTMATNALNASLMSNPFGGLLGTPSPESLLGAQSGDVLNSLASSLSSPGMRAAAGLMNPGQSGIVPPPPNFPAPAAAGPSGPSP